MNNIPPYAKYQAAHSGHDCDTHGDGDGFGLLIILFLKVIAVLLIFGALIWFVLWFSRKLGKMCIFLKPYFALAIVVLRDNGLCTYTNLSIIAWGLTLSVLMLLLFLY